METNLIPIIDFCIHHKIEITFIQTLESYGLLHTKKIKKAVFIKTDELSKLEQYIRLSQDLSINIEGLHAVSHLLELLKKSENEIQILRNELNYYKQIH